MFSYGILSLIIPFTYTLNSMIIGFLLLIPTGVDGTTQLLELRKSNNKLRLITGLLGGIGLMIILKTLIFIFIY